MLLYKAERTAGEMIEGTLNNVNLQAFGCGRNSLNPEWTQIPTITLLERMGGCLFPDCDGRLPLRAELSAGSRSAHPTPRLMARRTVPTCQAH
ncbi:hypothetical protein C0Q70_17020 [Pomacea canaliculata]|uniref:Uncharacterized protein n=1 Tax=Pomacea canaliculata TaxID=400727 RepID=A0A2T7NRF2_POMCA|nr:hypothetical protein C0Q70_17020 [Pomacea canaliculata]